MSAVRARYERAVETLVARLQQDRTLLAAVLFGSLAYDTVWEKSDIDLTIIGDEKVKPEFFTLTEEGISIHASLVPRSQFKRFCEGAMQGSFQDSLMARSRLLFSRDDALQRLWEGRGAVGARDRQAQLLRAGIACLPPLAKAEKWLAVKRDLDYAALYLLFTAEALARVEALAAGESPGREVIQDALRLNPGFFTQVYSGVLHGPKDEAHLRAVLESIDSYLTARIEALFGPLLDYLEEADGPRGVREIGQFFARQWNAEAVDTAGDWLADKGIIERAPIPLRLTKDSRVSVEEAGYYFAGRASSISAADVTI